jgi:hypothetical protein
MENEMITRHRWFWAWADDREEAWLSQMAAQGCHLVSPQLFGKYVFRRGEPRSVAYRLDYITSTKKDAHYYQIFQDAGWEHVGDMAGWNYWRKEIVDGEPEEIYTDPESKAVKYKRLLAFLAILLPIFIVTAGNLGGRGTSAFMRGVQFISFAFIVFFGYAMLRIGMRIRKLKS